MSTDLVSIVITSYNEEKNIVSVIRDCKKLSKLFPVEIIVVDGGSKDKTIEIAKRQKVGKIIAFPFKRGKGADFWVGAVASTGKYIIQIDADHQFQPSEIPLFVSKLKDGVDVVIATRFAGGMVQRGSLTIKNLFGNKFISIMTSLAVGRKITDTMAGFKGFTRNSLLFLDIKERHFEYEAEVIIKAIRSGMTLVEIPITYTKRKVGTSGIRALRDGLKVLQTIIRYSVLEKPRQFK